MIKNIILSLLDKYNMLIYVVLKTTCEAYKSIESDFGKCMTSYFLRQKIEIIMKKWRIYYEL